MPDDTGYVVPDLSRANELLHELQSIARRRSIPAVWDVAGPTLQNELCGKLEEARQLFHALAELQALSVTGHAPGCQWAITKEEETDAQ